MKDLELNHWLMLDGSTKTENRTFSSFFYLLVVFACAYIAMLFVN